MFSPNYCYTTTCMIILCFSSFIPGFETKFECHFWMKKRKVYFGMN